jgi:hypothetical protein
VLAAQPERVAAKQLAAQRASADKLLHEVSGRKFRRVFGASGRGATSAAEEERPIDAPESTAEAAARDGEGDSDDDDRIYDDSHGEWDDGWSCSETWPVPRYWNIRGSCWLAVSVQLLLCCANLNPIYTIGGPPSLVGLVYKAAGADPTADLVQLRALLVAAEVMPAVEVDGQQDATRCLLAMLNLAPGGGGLRRGLGDLSGLAAACAFQVWKEYTSVDAPCVHRPDCGVRYAVVDLILPVAVSTGGVVTVEALIADFLRPSGASEVDTWTCEQCKLVHKYQPTFSIGPAFAPALAPDPNAAPAAPPLLFVEFGRVTGVLGVKSMRAVDLAETIIVPITGADGVSRPVAYKLLWVLVHTAETSGAGHYVLFVLVGGRWWSIDDLDRHSRPRPWPSLGAVLFGDFTKFAVSQLVAAAGYERIPAAAAAAEPALRHGDSAAAATASPPTTAPATARSLDAPTAAATPPSAAAATPTPTPTASAPAELASEVRSAFPSPHTCAHPHT